MSRHNYTSNATVSLLLIAIFAISSQNTSAAEFGGYVALTTDYVKRGVTQSDEQPALQLGAEMNFRNGFFLGAWASTIDIENGPSRQRDLEIDYYFGYAFDATDSWRLTASAIAYNYPGQTGNVNYDYEELLLEGNFKDRVWLGFAYSPDLYNSGYSATNIELYTEWPIGGIWAIGGGLGQYDASNLTGSDYHYWQMGVTASLRWANVDLRYHDTDKSVPIISTPDRSQSRVALTLQIPF